MAKSQALLGKAAAIVVDMGSATTVLDAENAISLDAPLLLITDDITAIPPTLTDAAIIVPRSPEIDEQSTELLSHLRSFFSEAYQQLAPRLDDEPNRLLEKEEFRAAVIAAFSLLEDEASQLSSRGTGSRVMPTLRTMLEGAVTAHIISAQDLTMIAGHIAERNRIVHTRAMVSKEAAERVVADTAILTGKIRRARN